MARSNGDLVAKARQMTEDAGRRRGDAGRGARAAGALRVSLPLEGLRVLDLTRLLPGGFCTLLLADFGADVIKLEDTGAGDYVRWMGPGYDGAHESARSAAFLALNRGKRSMRLDLKTDGGREALLRLAARRRRAGRVVPARRARAARRRLGARCAPRTRASSTARSPATGRTGRSRRARATTSTTWPGSACSG